MRSSSEETAVAEAGSTAEDAEAFFELWLPFEVQIGHITGQWSGGGFDEGLASPEESDGAKYLEHRRQVLRAAFAQAQVGDEASARLIEALGVVLRKFSARVVHVVERGADEADEEQAPGRVALAELAQDEEFLGDARAYAALLHKWLLDDFAARSLRPSTGSLVGRRTVELGPVARFFNDAVHAIAVQGMSHAQEWEPRDDLAYAFHGRHSRASVTIGLPSGETAKDLWEYLRKGGPRMVKAHYALWARYYEDVEEHGHRFAMVSVPQFCADIGLKKHKNGGFRPEQKQEAMRTLKALTSIEMRVEKTMGTKQRRIRGPLWARGVEAEERDLYDDMLGQARQGDEAHWEPAAFSFAPGPWFIDADWRRYHKYLGKIGSGLLRLDNREEWAVLIGGYLATQGRANGYRLLRIRAGTILSRSGLAQTDDAKRRSAENRKKFEAAMDRLSAPEIAVLKGWSFPGVDTSEPDMDNAAELADYGAMDIYPAGDWRGWMVEIELPFESDALRLEEGRHKARSRAIAPQARRAIKQSSQEQDEPLDDTKQR